MNADPVAPAADPGQPRRQQREVQLGRGTRARVRGPAAATRCGSRSRIAGSASPRTSWRGSGIRSTRSRRRCSDATAARAWGWRSCGGSSSCTAAWCAPRARARTAAADSRSRCPWRQEPAVSQTTGPLEVVTIEPFLAGREILVVEDEPQTQELMRVVVEDMLGGVARMCDDGEQAIREAAERPPALILLDLMLPRVSGWEVARRLRQSPRTATVPIIAVSALSRPQEREAALHAGCDAYLTKPFTPDDAGPGRHRRRCRTTGSPSGEHRGRADLGGGGQPRHLCTAARAARRRGLPGRVGAHRRSGAGRAGAHARHRPDRARSDAARHERLRGHRAAARSARGSRARRFWS